MCRCTVIVLLSCIHENVKRGRICRGEAPMLPRQNIQPRCLSSSIGCLTMCWRYTGILVHWYTEAHTHTHTYRCSTAVMSNLSHNTFAPYHWPQPLVLFIQGGRSNTSRSYWRQNAAERCIRSYWAGGYHGSIGATLKCATADQN